MNLRDPLIVEKIDMYEKYNATAHRTYKFDLVHLDPPTPILRRGQTFKIAINLNRAYDIDTDLIRLLFKFGDRPNSVRGTLGVTTITNTFKYVTELDEWGVKLVGFDGNDVIIQVRSPFDSLVGIWSLAVETGIRDSVKSRNTYILPTGIYLLFNPWIKEDMVYMNDEKLLEEYILWDVGKIWTGGYGSARGRGWLFGQFDALVLSACMLVLERSGIDDGARGDPIKVSRAISKAINSNDDDGVIWANWSNNFEGGISPLAWTGSVPILREFLKTGKPVKYGQCWIYAAVAATICRAIGLPARVVTNLDSAHDCNATLSIDEFYDKNNKKLDYDPTTREMADTVWNFHVWNDVWMARPDLPQGYGGWQAIDGTPQEKSGKFYQCGPASLEAIKQGIVGFNYDAGFMISSVNADFMRWKEDPSTDFGYTKIYSAKDKIGRMILTKAPLVFDTNGESDREDITSAYKAPEGTVAERFSLLRAVRSTPGARKYYSYPTPDNEDVKFELAEIDRVKIGQSFTVIVNIKNKSSRIRSIDAILWAESVYYNGVRANMITSSNARSIVKPNDDAILRIDVTVDEYLDKLVDHGIMKLHAIATVQETKQTWAESDDFQVLKPTIKIEIWGDAIIGRASKIIFSFVNPLKRTLTNCKINYDSPAFTKNRRLDIGNVDPEQEVRVKDRIWPRKLGSQKIVATFTSKELTNVTGSAIIKFHDA